MSNVKTLERIADQILEKLVKNNCDDDAKVIIYMDDEFFIKMSFALKDNFHSSKLGYDFMNSATILGYQVFRVIPQYTRVEIIKHSDYEIVIL